MMRIGLVRGLVASLLLLPGISLALGLGDVHLNSPLNAPLDAEIELVNATQEDLATLDAKLASKETFARYGLEWPPFMSSITVTRDRSASGGHVLRIRSQETVTEPFLTLLIEATWARGRLVREYTVLLDPPVFAPNAVAAAPVPAPSVGASETTGQIARPAPQAQPQPAAPDSQFAPVGGGDSYQVQRGDSLSAIARRLSASTGARTDQLMVSIFRNNSTAFDGDMNRLHAGAVLRIPSGSEIAAVSPSEASAEISRYAGSWAASGRSERAGRLRLVPPSEAAASAGSGTDNSAEVAELQNRVRDLEGQLNESKRMLELRNTELADLQAKLAASQQAAAQPAPTPPVEEPTPTPEPVAPTPEAATPEAATPEAAVPTPEPEATPSETAPETPAEPVRTDSEETTAQPSLLDTLLGYWQWALGGVAILALAWLLLKSRGKRKTAEFDDRLGRLAEQGGDRLTEPVESLSDTGRMRAPAIAPTIPDDILVEESGTHRALQETQDIPLTAPTVRTDETISSDTAINLDQGDPLAEADFHMAYGLYDQAADLVRIAIQREPQRRDLKLKLLEVFFVWGNKEQFLTMSRELADTRAGSEQGEWEKIVIMGKQIAPEDPMFADGGAASAVGVDLNLDAGGAGRVDFDPFDVSSRLDVTGGGSPDPVDLDLGSALRDPDATGEGLALPDRDGQTTREMTVKMTPAGSEAPTVEQPALRPLDEPTIREKVEGAMRRKLSSDQTAELALDDLGLELGSLEQTDSSLGLKPVDAPGPHADAPTMVAGLDENSQRLLRAAAARQAGNGTDDSQITEHGASGTWFLTDRELGGDVDLTKGRSIDPNSTAAMAKFEMPEENYDISSTSRLAAIDRNNLDFPVEPTREAPGLGGGNSQMSGSATEELAVPDLEPVTLSEVGTKLDLARAYVDMGDPDGARNILNEVLSEGSASQKQEAQRLLESLPG
ncbi:MAG TPA: FimV/HubP family polar landmark protein [Steroidobacteraceae bacterium]|nr:FimV/HubP family polar landmark protein [Steroidobacteraceae bacterium]